MTYHFLQGETLGFWLYCCQFYLHFVDMSAVAIAGGRVGR